MVTQQFHETLEPLSEWLTATEKHLVHSEPIGTETSKLEEQISQHKVSLRGGFFFSLLINFTMFSEVPCCQILRKKKGFGMCHNVIIKKLVIVLIIKNIIL